MVGGYWIVLDCARSMIGWQVILCCLYAVVWMEFVRFVWSIIVRGWYDSK